MLKRTKNAIKKTKTLKCLLRISKLANVVKDDSKAPFSIATSPKRRGGL